MYVPVSTFLSPMVFARCYNYSQIKGFTCLLQSDRVGKELKLLRAMEFLTGMKNFHCKIFNCFFKNSFLTDLFQ